MKVADSMRRDWDNRARNDAFLYIASWRKDWDEKSFFESGEQDYQRFVEPVLLQLQFDPREKSMAELGCGAGRMTRSFASRFSSVSAVDISPEMQVRAKTYLRDFSNIHWILSDGETLRALDNCSVDFVFSYLVLQHFPSKVLVVAAVREMLRVLRPGGVFLFQFNGSLHPTMNWKGRALFSFLDALWSLRLRLASRIAARLAGKDPEMVGHTWRGVAMRSSEVVEALQAAGGLPSGFLGEGTPFAWCYGRKSRGDCA
jgi:ubiquinone/menaquinone biosynthesis C-methylase UbiE